jgi:DNA mismatch repair protein MutL
MNKIHLLDENIVNKIAAGEVVERPSSIVKELVENSIDAGSKNITVEIVEGGIPYIKVTDDGCGMNEIDAVLAFERHATSKIKTDEDLFNITSLGFRGEALASIAAVSKVELKTKEEDATFGTRLVVEGGRILEKSKCGCQKGTSVEVREVFFNTPARRKFLKRPATEAMYVTEVVTRLSLSNPEISFKYIKDNKLQFMTSGNGSIEDVILRLFGKEVHSALIFSEFETEGLKVKVFAIKSFLNYSNRNMQFFYVNGRYVRNKTLSVAVDEAFKTYVPSDRYPGVFLYIEVNPRFIDVNIHPSKLEIKFSDDKKVFEAVYKAIKQALKSSELIPEIKIEKGLKMEKKPSGEQLGILPLYEKGREEKAPLFIKESNTKENNEEKKQPETKPEDRVNEEKILKKMEDIKIVGTLFSTYIIVEKGDVFYIVDQHAAHERILYEKLTSKYEKVQSRQVILPIVVELQPGDMEVINQEKELLYKLGYVFDEFGNNSVVLREVPVILGQPEAKKLFVELVEKLRDRDFSNKVSFKEEEIATMACKAAVKAMDVLSEEEIYRLFYDLNIAENPYTCPHGRPVVISMTKTQLEKMFKRIK